MGEIRPPLIAHPAKLGRDARQQGAEVDREGAGELDEHAEARLAAAALEQGDFAPVRSQREASWAWVMPEARRRWARLRPKRWAVVTAQQLERFFHGLLHTTGDPYMLPASFLRLFLMFNISTVAEVQSPLSWPVLELPAISQEALLSLLEGRVAALRVPKFSSSAECQTIVATAEDVGFSSYSGVTPRIDKIGITQIEHADSHRARDNYFQSVRRAAKTRDHILNASHAKPDLLSRLIASLNASWPAGAGLAVEPTRGPYFAGVIRSIESARLHVDWAPVDAQGWEIENVTAQLAWNVYLENISGGELRLYRREWDPSLESFKSLNNYGYESEAAAGSPSVTISPALGDLIVFCPRYLHEVCTTTGPHARMTIGSFVGVMPTSSSLRLWS